MKRICLFFDGTWQDGVSVANEDSFTNVLRLARAVQPCGERHATASASSCAPPAPTSAPPPRPSAVQQIVYYSSGVGSEPNTSSWRSGITGNGLVAKVEQAYSFVCMNWVPGDEILLFGFSRGAYPARMVAGIINEIGILDRKKFCKLFMAMQNRGKHPDDQDVRRRTDKHLNPRRAVKDAQARNSPGGFLVKCVGVFDTVAALGLPQEVHPHEAEKIGAFGFSNTDLGRQVQHGFHALALNEEREDFRPILWTQSDEGRRRGQTIKQVWFAGSHSNIGGGLAKHDLSDITLSWMVSKTMHMVKYDERYIEGIPDCTSAWGKAPVQSSSGGLFALTRRRPRVPAAAFNPATHEYIHASVLEQERTPALAALLGRLSPDLVAPLLPFELRIKDEWHQIPACKGTLAPLPALGRLGPAGLLGFGKARTKKLVGVMVSGQAPPVVRDVMKWTGMELGNVRAKVRRRIGMGLGSG